MTNPASTRLQQEITAFVNGDLDAETRFTVARYLSQHPEQAAEVMAELAIGEGLKASLGAVETAPPPALGAMTARLTPAFFAQPRQRRGHIAMVGLVAGSMLGWGGHGLSDRHDETAPLAELTALLDTALDAQDAIKLNLALSDRSGLAHIDALALARQLDIELPSLPPDWSLRTAQVVATPERPGLALVIETSEMGEILLFGVVREIDGPDEPARAFVRNGRSLAFFEREQTAFVLLDQTGRDPALRDGAETLRHRFN